MSDGWMVEMFVICDTCRHWTAHSCWYSVFLDEASGMMNSHDDKDDKDDDIVLTSWC